MQIVIQKTRTAVQIISSFRENCVKMSGNARDNKVVFRFLQKKKTSRAKEKFDAVHVGDDRVNRFPYDVHSIENDIFRAIFCYVG